MRQVAEEVGGGVRGDRPRRLHRVGALHVGDVAVVVAASAAHRGKAYDASRALIDRLKATTPIWKHQVFADGRDEWVGTP